MAKKKAATDSFMGVSQAAAEAGVSKQTVDYYCLLGLISPIRRPGKSGRFFDAALVKQIRLIHRLNDSGYTLRAIRETYFRPKTKAAK